MLQLQILHQHRGKLHFQPPQLLNASEGLLVFALGVRDSIPPVAFHNPALLSDAFLCTRCLFRQDACDIRVLYFSYPYLHFNLSKPVKLDTSKVFISST